MVPRAHPLPHLPWSNRIYADIIEAAEATRAIRRAGIERFEAVKRAELASARREAAARASHVDKEADQLTRQWRKELRRVKAEEVRAEMEARRRDAEEKGWTVAD